MALELEKNKQANLFGKCLEPLSEILKIAI